MGQMEKVGMIKWVLLETEAPFFTWFAWELWVIITAARKASHTVCLETEFTVGILQAIIFRYFLQKNPETFWPAHSLSHRGHGPGALAALQLPSAAGWQMPDLPAALTHTPGKNAVSSLSSFTIFFGLFYSFATSVGLSLSSLPIGNLAEY